MEITRKTHNQGGILVLLKSGRIYCSLFIKDMEIREETTAVLSATWETRGDFAL
jgi:hypothetical protein